MCQPSGIDKPTTLRPEHGRNGTQSSGNGRILTGLAVGGQKTRGGQGTSGPHEQTTKHYGTGNEQEVEGNTPPTSTVAPDGLHIGGTKSTGTTNKIYQPGNPIPGTRPLDPRTPAGPLSTDTGGAPGLWNGRNPKG